jgi:hypothetical protein
MMPSLQEIAHRVQGAWRLARFDASGVPYFGDSPQAALRSFFAALLVVPAFVATLLLAGGHGPAIDPLAAFLVWLLVYCLSWTFYPVVTYRISQVIGREQNFYRFLSATNWAAIIIYHLQLVIVILIVGDVFPSTLASLLWLGMYAYLIGYQWFVARHCLDVSIAAAAGFAFLQFVIDFLIASIATGIIYGSGG